MSPKVVECKCVAGPLAWDIGRREGTDVSRAVMSSSVGKGEFKCDSSWYRQGSEFKSGSEFKCDSDDQARVSSSVTRGFKYKIKGHGQWLKFPVVMSMG